MRLYAEEPELRLWRELREKRLGVAFRRQVVLGERYIVDVFAPEVGLVVEVDGGAHALRRRADQRRDRDLGRLGHRVLRMPVEVVIGDLAEVVRRVRNALRGHER
jgi:very-short-patch-repair endonuclease